MTNSDPKARVARNAVGEQAGRSPVLQLAKHLSYSNVVSTMCLLLLVGSGTAYAAGLANDSVRSRHIQNGQVKTVDLGTNAVTSSKVGDDALTGADIDEDSLVGVNASSVSGMRIKKITWQVPTGTSKEPILTFDGNLTLYGECVPFGDALDLNVRAFEDNSQVVVMGGSATHFDDTDGSKDMGVDSSNQFDGLDAGEEFRIDDVAGFVAHISGSRWVRFDFSTPSGFVAHVDLYMAYSGVNCVVMGTAIGG